MKLSLTVTVSMENLDPEVTPGYPRKRYALLSRCNWQKEAGVIAEKPDGQRFGGGVAAIRPSVVFFPVFGPPPPFMPVSFIFHLVHPHVGVGHEFVGSRAVIRVDQHELVPAHPGENPSRTSPLFSMTVCSMIRVSFLILCGSKTRPGAGTG